MVVFTCKYKCTIKGSELDVVLELHGHGLSWQTESSFVEHEARSTEQSLCLSAGGQNAEVFPCQPPQAWKLWPPWPQPIQRILPLVQSFLRKVLSLTSLLITFRSFHRRPKAVAKGRRLSSTLEFVLLMKPKDSSESQKPPQQCWPESFCKSGKFLRQVHYWLKNFRILCNTKYPDNMQSVWMNWKVSGWSKKCRDELESFHMM